jgi:CBS domain-containing protein
MKVSDVMTANPVVCAPEDNLTKAAYIMWSHDCGIVPVVDAEGSPVGVITDRDIAIAAASRGRLTADIRASEMNFGPLKSCSPDDDVKDALRRMRKYKIKRLCVIDQSGKLAGILSLSDLLNHAGGKKRVRKLVYSTFENIAKPQPIVLEEQASATEDAAEDPPEST